MLAVKSALADSDNIPILVFDEIDTGIGATIAKPVGEEIKNLSKYHQVIVITHLPQIAGFADVHIKVEKQVKEGKTSTGISVLEKDVRVKEIARMFGSEEDEISNKHARKILNM
jgi:DNA repair protein RecN (Recombination protein N)